MKEMLKAELLKKIEDVQDYSFDYLENKNDDALTDAWLENRTSYIYKVGVMTAIHSNKSGIAHIVIGVQRGGGEKFAPELKGYFYFSKGENDDMGQVIHRALGLLQAIHPAFDL